MCAGLCAHGLAAALCSCVVRASRTPRVAYREGLPQQSQQQQPLPQQQPSPPQQQQPLSSPSPPKVFSPL
jgi:hypothetical protein